jgi:beta-mannosidase
VDCADADAYGAYCSYRLLGLDGAEVSGGSALFCAPKHFAFLDPKLAVSLSADGAAVTVRASAYARAVELECENGDVVLEDNYFDMDAGERTVRILRGEGLNGEAPRFRARSVWTGDR